MFFVKLQQIPEVPIQILEHSHQPVWFLLRFPHKIDSMLNHLAVVSPEIIGVEEEKDPSTRLVANE